MLHHPHFVADCQRKCAAAAAFADHKGKYRHAQSAHLVKVSGNRLALSVFLCLHARISTGSIDKGDHGTAKFFCLFHQTDCLSVSFRRRHTIVARCALLHRTALLDTDHSHRLTIQPCDTADDRRIIPEIAVSVELHEIIKHRLNIILCLQTAHLSGLVHLVPGTLFLCLAGALAHQLRGLIDIVFMHRVKVRKALARMTF